MATENDLPLVPGLEEFVKANSDTDTTDKGQITTGVQPDPAQQQIQTPSDQDGQVEKELAGILKAFTDPDGKIRTKDVLKSYKEIQGFTTKVSQENAKLKEDMQRLKEEAELRQFQPPATQGVRKSFEELFIENPEQAITTKAMEIANAQRITEVLEEKKLENVDSFQERLAYVQMVAQQPQYAHLQFSPKGVQKLFEIADKKRTQIIERNAHESLKVLFGEDIDLEKLKALTRKDAQQQNINQSTNSNLNAFMPNSGTSTRTGADINMNVNDLERQKQDAIASGNSDKVAEVLLKQALLR